MSIDVTKEVNNMGKVVDPTAIAFAFYVFTNGDTFKADEIGRAHV